MAKRAIRFNAAMKKLDAIEKAAASGKVSSAKIAKQIGQLKNRGPGGGQAGTTFTWGPACMPSGEIGKGGQVSRF